MVLTDARKLTDAELAYEALSTLQGSWLTHEYEDCILLPRKKARRLIELLEEAERRGNAHLFQKAALCPGG